MNHQSPQNSVSTKTHNPTAISLANANVKILLDKLGTQSWSVT